MLTNRFLSIRSPLVAGFRGFHGSQRLSNQEPLTRVEEEGGIRTVTLNNPKQRNALSLDMMRSLYDSLCVDQSTRVVVLKSNGPVFSSGHNLKELTQKEGRDFHVEVFAACTKLMNHVTDLPVPVIAQVKGLATAAGCQLVATCDVAVVSEKAKFATPGVSIGLFCSTPGVAVARAVPRKVAMEMLLTGNPISAQEALKYGLVSKVVAEDDLEDETMLIARRSCETSRPVVALGKKFFYEQIQMTRHEAYRHGEKIMVDNLQMHDAQEGIAAFIGKRPPRWTHEE